MIDKKIKLSLWAGIDPTKAKEIILEGISQKKKIELENWANNGVL